MAEITKLQLKIMEDLYRRDFESIDTIRIQPDQYILEEKDSIMQVRELVYHLDLLKSHEFIEVREPYYLGSDSISMDYLNNAIEIHDRRIKLSNLGIQYVEAIKNGWLFSLNQRIKHFFQKHLYEHPYRLIFSHILMFVLGLTLMWLILNL